jgi:hypothetical protein
MLHIDWERLPDIPKQGPAQSGFQDSDGGWLDDSMVVTAFGYSSGGIPGFLNTSWILNTSSSSQQADDEATTAPTSNTTCSYELPTGKCGGGFEPMMCYTAHRLFPFAKNGGCGALSCHGVASYCDSASGFCLTNSTPKSQPCIAGAGPAPPPSPPSPWQQLPSAPVCGRQEVSAAIVDGAVYYVGGFSYIAGPSTSHPYCFNDTLKLSRNAQGEWAWAKLPDFPYVISSFGLVSVGTSL